VLSATCVAETYRFLEASETQPSNGDKKGKKKKG